MAAVEEILLHFTTRERIQIACCSKRLLQLVNSSPQLWAQLDAQLESADQAERFTAWFAGKQHLVRRLHLGQGAECSDNEPSGSDDEEGEAGKAKSTIHNEIANHALYTVGMLAGQPLQSLTWHIRGDIARLEVRCLEDAPATITLGADLSRLTNLTELVIGHGSCDANLELLTLPPSLLSLGLSPVTTALPEAVVAATHLQKLSISNVDLLLDSPPGPELYGLDQLAGLTALALNFCQLQARCLAGMGQALPEEFAALTNLRALELNNTTFEGLDPLQPILGLSQLRTLLMSECDLASVPEALWELPALEVLDIGFSALEELNFEGEGAQHLQYLCISPAVAAFNTDKLATLTSLPNLYLRGSIAHLDPDVDSLLALLAVISELPALRRVSFGGCLSEMLGKDVRLLLEFAELARKRPRLQLVDVDLPPITHFRPVLVSE
ncbi:hypothetical protein N2152v2_010872 [Parachlorella kessleri]